MKHFNTQFKTLLLVAILFQISSKSFGQLKFQRDIGGISYESALTTLPTHDGGFITYGASKSNSTLGDIMLIKYDNCNNLVWQKSYGAPNSIDYVSHTHANNSMAATPDSGFVFTGYTESASIGGGTDAILVKVDKDGNIVWNRNVGSTGDDRGLSVMVTRDNEIILSSITDVNGDDDVILSKFDANGQNLWHKRYYTSKNEAIYAMIHTLDGNYMLAGGTGNGGGASDAMILKTDTSGGIIYEKTFSGTYGDDVFYGAAECSADTSYMFCGLHFITSSPIGMIYHIKSDGTKIWQKDFTPNILTDIQPINDTTFVVVGNIAYGNYFRAVAMIIEKSGAVVMAKQYENTYNQVNIFNDVKVVKDGFFLTGWMGDFNAKGLQMYISKTDFQLQSGCQEYNLNAYSSNRSVSLKTVMATDTFGIDSVGNFEMDTFSLSVTQDCKSFCPIVNLGTDSIGCDSILLNPGNNSCATYLWSTGATTSTIYATNSGKYWVAVTRDSCTRTDTIEVFIYNLSQSAQTYSTSICRGDTIKLAASGGYTYSWSPSTGVSSTTDSIISAFPDTTTTYHVVVTKGICNASGDITIAVNQVPDVQITNDTTICNGDSITLNASGAASFEWWPTTNMDDSLSATPTVKPSQTTTYYVKGSLPSSCFDIDTVTITISIPTVSVGADTIICPGDSIQLNASGSLNYVWSPNYNISNTSVSNPWVWPSNNTTYYVQGSNLYGCKAYDSISITIANPAISAGQDTSICAGDTIALHASGGATYQWWPTADMNDSLSANPWVYPNQTTSYIVKGSVSNCYNTDTIVVNVLTQYTVDASNNRTICAGDTIQLGASGVGNYIWWPNSYISNINIDSPWVHPMTTTTYFVKGTGIYRCSNTDSVTISVGYIVVDAGNDTTICPGDTVMLNATGGVSYSWSPGASLSDSLTGNPLAYPSQTTTYWVTGTSVSACQASDQITITVRTNTINAGADKTICAGDTITLNASGGTSYLWWPTMAMNDSASASPRVHPDTTTMYYVQTVCGFTDSVLVTVIHCASGIGQASSPYQKVWCDGSVIYLSNELAQTTPYTLYGMDGKRILSGNATNGLTSLDINNLAKGIYMIQLNNAQSYKIIRY